MATELRKTGISVVGDMPWGTHFCCFYETAQDLLDILVPYFKAGLENHEFCLYIASEPVIAEEAERVLREAVPNFERYLAEGQIEIVAHLHWYLTDDRFDPLRVRQGWIVKLEQALARGYAGMRFAANIFWLEKQDWDSFADYEGKLDEVFGELRIIAVCTYSLAHCSAADMLDVVRHHQFSVARRHGAWERLEGPELQRAHAEIRKLNANLERQVEERTAQLTAANEQLTREIAERKQAEDRLRLVIDTIPAMVFTALPDGSVDFVNQRWLQYMGLSLEDVQGWGWDVTIHPEDRARSIDHWRSTMAAGQSAENELRVRRADGVYRWILGRFVPLRDEMGNIVKWYGVSTDIDDRKRAEEALRASEARLQAAIDAADIGLWDWDLVSGQINWLGHHEKLSGFAPGEFDGTYPGFEKRIHPEDLEELNRVVQRARDEGSEYAHEYRVIWPDGSIHWIAGRGRFVYNETGQPIRMYGAVFDITERERVEALLHAREQEFRAIVENAPDQIIRYDKEFRRTYVNPAVTQAYGLPREAFIAKPVGSIVENAGLKIDIDEVTAIRRQIKSVFDTGKATEFEVAFPSPGGRRTYWTRMYPEFDPKGVVINVLAISREITNRKRAEEALRRNEEKFKALFESAPVGIALLNRERKIVNMNPVLEQIMRTNKEELIAGTHWSRTYIRPDGTPKPFSEFASERAINENRPIYGVETGIILEDGQLIWVQVNAVPLGLPDASVVVITQDITERKHAEEALRESEEKFSAAFRASPIALVITTLDGKYVEVNQGFCDLLGYSREELLGKTAIDLGIFNAETRQEWVEALAREGGLMTNRELSFRVRNGISRTTLSSVETITLHGVPHRLSTVLDITERKQAEAAIQSLLQISEKLHATFDIDALLNSLVIEAMELIDAEMGWSGLRSSEGMVCHTHITRDLQVIPFEYFWPPGVGLPGWVLVHKVPYVMNDAQSDTVIIPEIRERFGVNSAIDTPILDAQGEVIGFFEVNNKKNSAGFSESDVEKLVAVSRIASIALQNAMSYGNLERAEKALRESQLHLQLLSRQLLQAQEAERRSIARELHDEIGQQLTGLGLLLSSQHPSPDQLADAQALVRDLIAQVRSLALDLRPAMLDDLGLVPALVWLFERYTAQTHIAVRFEHARLEEQRFAPEVETSAYRIVQEALTNVARHADVSEVTVRLWTDDDALSVIIVDRGRGFDLQTVRTTLSSGLAGMAERAALLGGSLTIESAPPTGTRVTASLPLHTDSELRGQEHNA